MGKFRVLKWGVLLVALTLLVALVGCSGDDGSVGATGAVGPTGPDGADGQDAVGLTAFAAQPLAISGLVFGANADGFIIATFDAASGTTPVTGMTESVTSISFTGLLPGTDGASDEWTYWGAATDALVENSTGNYTLTTDKKVADAPAGTTTQRALIQFNNGAVYERANAIYDFLSSDLATQVASGKEVVNDASCKDCHGYGVTIHSFGRNNTQACAVCHSPNYNDTMAVHEADLVTMVHQIHTGKAEVLGNLHWGGHGDGWGIVGTGDNLGKEIVANMVYPDNMLNCDKCHNTVAQADNYKNKPTMVACGSCHTTVTFDGVESVGIKGLPFTHSTQTNNAMCTVCHNGAYVDAKHVDSQDAALRTVVATITNIDLTQIDVDGSLTVAFSVTEDGLAKTDLAAASFNLAKLVPATAGVPSYWESYLMKMRTKTANHPVTQAQSESVTDGTLTNNADGTYTYKFGFKNGSTPGDIRTISKVGTRMAASYALNEDYNNVNLPSMIYPVEYEADLTHRLSISITGNAKEAFIDFVPDGVSDAQTRNIVSWDTACVKCHGTKKIHSGYSIERCVGCHTKNTYDPFSSSTAPALTPADDALSGTASVELGTIVHKIHMGRFLPSVQEGGEYVINGSHNYSKAQYPAGLPSFSPATNNVVPANRTSSGRPADCKLCHDESNVAMTEAANWRIAGPACGNCHDGAVDKAHIAANTFSGVAACTICHTPGGAAPDAEEAHYGIQQ
ncbi:MAG: hypothetical protein KKB30_05995 [Proteobacteria bacterium]|nr:hypothetical protein [Pseudomonadota bacterium]MBU1716252.1 hypothetical protein [Pseudomonadota bacterium]